MSKFVRASKVRHVYCQQTKHDEHFSNIRLSSATGDHNYIKANTKYFAVPVSAGGGSLAVWPLDKPGRLPPQTPCFDKHKGPVLDFDFHTMHDNLIASGGDDCTVKLWGIPEGGPTDTSGEPLVDMNEHQRKITVVRFHPTAEHVLASGSADKLVKLWDVSSGDCKVTIKSHGDMVLDADWNYNGSLLATTCKDKQVRLFDPRTGEETAKVEAHDGPKTQKLTWLGKNHGTLATVGFTRQSKRQFKIWDPKKMSQPVCTADIDQAAGVLMPFFDEGTNLLFLGGKGDGNVRYYEMVDDAPWQFLIESSKGTPVRGLCMVPKRSVDVMKCEVVRMLKLTRDSVEPMSFICPRKSDLFQEDLFPDCYAGKAAMTSDEFFDGKNKDPVMMSMDPSKAPKDSAPAKSGTVIEKKKSPKEYEEEIARLNKYIDSLTSLLDKNNIKVPDPK